MDLFGRVECASSQPRTGLRGLFLPREQTEKGMVIIIGTTRPSIKWEIEQYSFAL
jgi:hypothetical protein